MSEGKETKLFTVVISLLSAIVGAFFGAILTQRYANAERDAQNRPQLSVPAKIKVEKGETLVPLRNDSARPLIVHEIRIRRISAGSAPCAAIPREQPVIVDPDRFQRGDWQTHEMRIEIDPGKTVDIPIHLIDSQMEELVSAEVQVIYGELDNRQILDAGEVCIQPKKDRDREALPPVPPGKKSPDRNSRWRYQRQSE